LMRKLLKKYGFVPDKLVTDDLRSYGAAASDLGIANRHERGRWRNNRADNSHQPTRRRERKMLGFKSLRFAAYVARPAAKSAPAIVVHPAAKRDQAGVTLILGHGAGAGQTSGFMVIFSTGLAALRRRNERAGRIRVAHRFQTSSPLLARGWTRAALWPHRLRGIAQGRQNVAAKMIGIEERQRRVER
jgi:DDE domain